VGVARGALLRLWRPLTHFRARVDSPWRFAPTALWKPLRQTASDRCGSHRPKVAAAVACLSTWAAVRTANIPLSLDRYVWYFLHDGRPLSSAASAIHATAIVHEAVSRKIIDEESKLARSLSLWRTTNTWVLGRISVTPPAVLDLIGRLSLANVGPKKFVHWLDYAARQHRDGGATLLRKINGHTGEVNHEVNHVLPSRYKSPIFRLLLAWSRERRLRSRWFKKLSSPATC